MYFHIVIVFYRITRCDRVSHTDIECLVQSEAFGAARCCAMVGVVRVTVIVTMIMAASVAGIAAAVVVMAITV